MFKNKSANGKLNICGTAIASLRKKQKLSQRAFADQMQLMGIDINKNAVQKIESGQRFVTDIELKAFASYYKVTVDSLLQ